ncbi:5075_t:CDS:2 [Gigaspora margarita]|uniref:5075_t:CDS:1 n=1 Tax=Gigaspora margarita TaxID=4874 RepID=A0ABM8W0C0_GIGMA|nr:5075_t:CDS:2 [Gigaspora margarita]
MSTVTGDYAILNVNSSIDYNTSSLTTPGGLYITFIPYNQSVTTGYLLSQITLNVTFSGLYCDIAPSGVDEAVICLAYLTTSATKKFKMLNEDNKADYLKALLKEISVKLPVLYGLLTTDGNYQYISINSNENTQFAIYVNKISPKLDSNATVPGIISDLNNMIKYKRITTFSYGLTNDLDENYGFKPKGDKLGDYKKEIISFVTVAAVNFIVYNFSQSDKVKIHS